jgi:hypothetical protein
LPDNKIKKCVIDEMADNLAVHHFVGCYKDNSIKEMGRQEKYSACQTK